MDNFLRTCGLLAFSSGGFDVVVYDSSLDNQSSRPALQRDTFDQATMDFWSIQISTVASRILVAIVTSCLTIIEYPSTLPSASLTCFKSFRQAMEDDVSTSGGRQVRHTSGWYYLVYRSSSLSNFYSSFALRTRRQLTRHSTQPAAVWTQYSVRALEHAFGAWMIISSDAFASRKQSKRKKVFDFHCRVALAVITIWPFEPLSWTRLRSKPSSNARACRPRHEQVTQTEVVCRSFIRWSHNTPGAPVVKWDFQN